MNSGIIYKGCAFRQAKKDLPQKLHNGRVQSIFEWLLVGGEPSPQQPEWTDRNF